MVVEFTLDDIDTAARRFLAAISDNKVIAMHGDMGAGKTTFIHHVCNLLKVNDVVSSPTFSIINEYQSGDGESVFHLDLYRLKNEAEVLDAGVEECLFSGKLCMVEWPENAGSVLPPDSLHCYLSVIDYNKRKLQINL